MKVWKYVVVFTGMIMFLYMAGIKTGADPLFNALGLVFEDGIGFTSVKLSISAFFNFLFSTSTGILATLAAIGATIVATFATRAKPENLILLPFITGVLVIFLSTIVGVIQYSISLGQGWVSGLIILVLTPLGVGFITSLGEFFRGTD